MPLRRGSESSAFRHALGQMVQRLLHLVHQHQAQVTGLQAGQRGVDGCV